MKCLRAVYKQGFKGGVFHATGYLNLPLCGAGRFPNSDLAGWEEEKRDAPTCRWCKKSLGLSIYQRSSSSQSPTIF